MTRWFSPQWRIGGASYVGFVALLAGYSLTGDHPTAYYAMLVLTLPAGYLMVLPIYLTGGTVDWALGYELDGSPFSLTIAIVGFAFAAALQVVMVRILALAIATVLDERRSVVARRT